MSICMALVALFCSDPAATEAATLSLHDALPILKSVTAGANPMSLKRGIDKAVELVVEELKRISAPSKGRKEIAQVGTISANNDPEIGKIIADAMEKVGKDGVITVEEAKGLETTLETVDGMQF